MTAAIGGIACSFVHDHAGSIPTAMRQRSIDWQLPGVNGYGIALAGYGDSEFEVEAVLYSDQTAIWLWAGMIQALQGKIVSIVDDHGFVHSRCFLKEVGNVLKTPARVLGTPATMRGAMRIRGMVV